MITFASLKNFFKTNSILVILGSIQYYFLSNFMNSMYASIIFSLIYFIKNYLLVKLVDTVTQHKQDIHLDECSEFKESYRFEHTINIFVASVMESLTTIFITNKLQLYNHIHYCDLLTFIPLSLCFELVFDFFHYWAHRMMHSNKLLYNSIHKKHHFYHHTKSIGTFHHHPIDLLITNVIPYMISLYIVRLSLYQSSLMIIYKTIIEISGHTGKRLYPISSFPQLIWLPKFLGIELYSEDHSIHHTHYTYNYSKRFSIWDKMFGTYKEQDYSQSKKIEI